MRKHGLKLKNTSEKYCQIAILSLRHFCPVLVSINYKSDRNILQTCFEFAQKIVESDKSENSILNLLQIKKRLNILTQMDSNYLHSLMNQSSVEIRFAAACILGNKEQDRYLFDKEFANEQKERFLEYPIYYLLSLD